MHHLLRRTFLRPIVAATLAAAACLPVGGFAADVYPNRPISLIVPYGPGTSTDIFARVIADAMGPELGQTVVVKNVSGAGGTLGLRQMLREAPDGHTLGLVTTSSIAINRAFYKNLPYDSLSDISIVGIPSSTPNVLVVPSDKGIRTVADLVKSIKGGEPSRYNSMGNGTSQQLLSVQLSQVAQLSAEHVPYRGQDGLMGMLGGQTLFAFASVPSIAALVEGGKMNILAATGTQAPARFPQVPTMVSLGYKGFEEGSSWYGVGLDSKTPQAIKDRLAAVIAKVAASDTVKKRLLDAGFEPAAPMTQAERDAFGRRQVDFWGKLVAESGVEAPQ